MSTPNENAPAAAVATTGAPAAEPKTEGQQQTVTAPEWVPAELRENKSITKFKEPGELAKSYVNLEKMLGSRTEVPADDAPKEQWDAWFKKIGVPETADGYDPPAVPEGMTLDQGILKATREKFRELGVPKAQAKKLMDWYITQEIERTNSILRERAVQHEQGMESLNKKWGAAAPRQIALCQRVVAELGGESVKKILDETGVGNEPAIVEFLARVGGMMEEDKLITQVNVGTSKEQAEAEIAKIRAEAGKDKKHPLRNKAHPEHAAVAKRFQDLYQIAYPDMQNDQGF
jgi:hypothetical protein